MNDTSLSWTKVFESLVEEKAQFDKGKLSSHQLTKAAEIISANIVTTLSELDLPKSVNAVEELIKLFPVIFARNKNGSFFIHLHEFVYAQRALELLLFEKPTDNETPLNNTPDIQETVTVESQSKKNTRPSIVNIFPTIIENTTTFLKQQGYAAQCRRRTEKAIHQV